jgi:hypothetical protein
MARTCLRWVNTRFRNQRLRVGKGVSLDSCSNARVGRETRQFVYNSSKVQLHLDRCT